MKEGAVIGIAMCCFIEELKRLIDSFPLDKVIELVDSQFEVLTERGKLSEGDGIMPVVLHDIRKLRDDIRLLDEHAKKRAPEIKAKWEAQK